MKFQFTFPQTEEYTLSNGLNVIWLPDFSQPVLAVTLQIPRGRHRDPFGLEGTAELAASLMMKGIPSLTSDQFSEKFEHAGATLFTEVKEEYMIFGVRMLNRAANDIIPIFWEMIYNPALDNAEFKRLKREMITGLQAEFSDPGTLAGRHFYGELFGSSHPAGRNHSIFSVKGITLEHIKEYYKTYVCPHKSQLIVAGARETAEMQSQWEKLFESWSNDAEPSAEPEKKQPVLKENRIRIIDKPEYSQTTLILGHPAIHELHEQKVILAVANFILGGGNFSSRLMKRMRTETGRTYSIASALNSHKDYGVFTIATSTQNSQLESVINSVFDTYKDFVDNGATESEIEKAKQFAAGNMAFELEGLNNIVEKLLWLRFFGRDNSFIESYEKLFLPVTTTSIKEALQKNFSYKHFVIIAVGQKIEIEKQLEPFGSVRCFHYQANPLVD